MYGNVLLYHQLFITSGESLVRWKVRFKKVVGNAVAEMAVETFFLRGLRS